MDATYRRDLRELNELNFARFDAKLEQRLAELRTDLIALVGALETRLERRLGAQSRWLFGMWITMIGTMIGTTAALWFRR